MAKEKATVEIAAKDVEKVSDKASKYGGERRWTKPSKRAKSYADERKAKVHQHGPKEGKELTDYEAGIRSGYLQAQSDHAGMFRYKQALEAGLSKDQAVKFSRERGTKLGNKAS